MKQLKIGIVFLVLLVTFVSSSSEEEPAKNVTSSTEEKERQLLAFLDATSSEEKEIVSAENSAELVKSETDKEEGSNESQRTARSIGNIARLLLGGNVPPDHPLVKYPDPTQAAASVVNPVVAAVPGMNVQPNQVVPGLQQQLLQQQQQQQPLQQSSGTFQIPSFLLPNSVSNFFGQSSAPAPAPAPAYSQNVYSNVAPSQAGVNSFQQQSYQQPQPQYNQAQSSVPNYQAANSNFNTGGNSFNTQANTYNSQSYSPQTGTNTFTSPSGFNGNTNIPPPGYPNNAGNSYQTNGATYNSGSGSQFNQASFPSSYNAPQTQQPFEGSGPPYQTSSTGYSNQAPWQGGAQDSSYYGSSNTYLTSPSYNSQPASNNYQSQATQAQPVNYNSQQYNQPQAVQSNSYNTAQNYQSNTGYNNNYNNVPVAAPQPNSYNNYPSSNNSPAPNYSPASNYNPAPNYSSAPQTNYESSQYSAPQSAYSNPPSNTYGNYQPPQGNSNIYSQPQQNQQPAPVSNYNNGYNNPPQNNNYNSQYGASVSNSYGQPQQNGQSYNAPPSLNVNFSVGKENFYSSPQQNSVSTPYPNKSQNLSKYPRPNRPEGQGRPKGEYDQLKSSVNGGRRENKRKPGFSNGYSGNLDVSFQSSKPTSSYAIPPSTYRDLKGGRAMNFRNSKDVNLPISLKVPKSSTITYQRYPKNSFKSVSGPTVKIYASKKSDTVLPPTPSQILQQHQQKQSALAFSSQPKLKPVTRLNTMVNLTPPPQGNFGKVIRPYSNTSSTSQLRSTNAYPANYRAGQLQKRNSQESLQSMKDPVIQPSITVFQTSYV